MSTAMFVISCDNVTLLYLILHLYYCIRVGLFVRLSRSYVMFLCEVASDNNSLVKHMYSLKTTMKFY